MYSVAVSIVPFADTPDVLCEDVRFILALLVGDVHLKISPLL